MSDHFFGWSIAGASTRLDLTIRLLPSGLYRDNLNVQPWLGDFLPDYLNMVQSVKRKGEEEIHHHTGYVSYENVWVLLQNIITCARVVRQGLRFIVLSEKTRETNRWQIKPTASRWQTSTYLDL